MTPPRDDSLENQSLSTKIIFSYFQHQNVIVSNKGGEKDVGKITPGKTSNLDSRNRSNNLTPPDNMSNATPVSQISKPQSNISNPVPQKGTKK